MNQINRPLPKHSKTGQNLLPGQDFSTITYFIMAITSAMVLAAPAISFSFGSDISICAPPITEKESVNPVVITDCTETALRTTASSGGHITFDCGPVPVTISLNSPIELNTAVDTVIDGGGLVTISGQNTSRLFYKGWHNGYDITVTFQNIRMVNGKAPSGDEHSGGAFYGGHPGTRIHIINSTFENNSTRDIHTADNQGGALFVHNSYETIISGSEFISNEAGSGGAFGGIATGLFIFNSRFGGNSAVDNSTEGIVKGHGGAIHLDGVTNSYNPSSNRRVHICGSIFEDNTAIRGGGAMKVTVSDNKGTLATYEKSAFINNISSGSSGIEGQGGAIYHIEDDQNGGSQEKNIELFQCLFQGNNGWQQGGGAWFTILGKGDIINNTFFQNSAVSSDLGKGGGLVISSGTYNIINNTFVENYAWFHGGGIQASNSADMTLQNNLFVDNESVRDWACYQTNRAADHDGGGNFQYPADRYNQSGSPADCDVSANPIVDNPSLRALADNSGPTMTMALPQNSHAVGAGTTINAPIIDQRGYERKIPIDSGAFQYNIWPPVGFIDVIKLLQICSGLAPDISGLRVTDIDGNNLFGLVEVVYVLQIMAIKP